MGLPHNIVPIMGKNSFTNTYAMHFDGVNEYLYRSEANFRSGDSAGTISFRIKSTFNSAVTGSAVFNSADEASSTRYLVISILNGLIGLSQRNNDTDSTVFGNTFIADGAWHHVLVISDGSTWTMYVDNVLQTLSVTSGSNNGDWFADTANRDNISVGAFRRNTTVAFQNGTLDEIAVYDYALNSTQRSTEYNGGAPGNKASLSPVFWIRADEPTDDMTGTTGVINDVSGGLHHMTPQNTESGDKVLY